MQCWSFELLVDWCTDPHDIDECNNERQCEIESCQHEQFGELMPSVLHVHEIVELQYDLDECKTDDDRNRKLRRNHFHSSQAESDESKENHQSE